MQATQKMLLLFILALLFGLPARAAPIDDAYLYTAMTFVTGQREETRAPGIKRTFKTVLVKVTGDRSILNAGDLQNYLARANDYVDEYSYRDRMEGIPHHDEQGSRDRPYDLTVRFKRDRIDEIVEKLGYKKWPAPRPTITPLVKIEFQNNSFLVASDAEESIGQREALQIVARDQGLAIAMPDKATLNEANASSIDMDNPPEATLSAIARKAGGDIILAGVLNWNADRLIWNSRWLIRFGASEQRWKATSGTFDKAFREAMNRVAKTLSGSQ